MAYMSDDGEFYIYTVIEIKTGEIVEGENIIESLDDKYELISGCEWRKFKLVDAA